MSKGSQPSGQTTVVQNTANPTQQAQLPYLTGQAGQTGLGNPNIGWNQAVNLAVGDPYQYFPGQTLANFNSNIPTGYQDLINNGANVLPGIAGNANNAFSNAVGGGYSVQNSPAFNGFQSIANGAGAPSTNIQALYNNAATANNGAVSQQVSGIQGIGNEAAAGNPAAMDQLIATANGAYLNQNPYIAGEFKAAAQPVINAYQTATAPQTDSNFEAAGRYGSGALANAQSQNQLNLGTTLGNLGANLYGQDYANERGLQTSAAGTLGNLQNQNLTTGANALDASGNLYLNALGQSTNALQAGGALNLGELAQQNAALGGLQSGYQAGNTAANQALLMEPNVLSGNLAGGNALVQGGTGLTGIDQAQINDLMQRFYGNQQAPWQTNEQYLNQIGQPTSGSANSTTTSPYFTNGLANVLGAGLGGLGLFNGLNTATGGSLGTGLSSALGGIFGTGSSDSGALAALVGGGLFGGDSLAGAGGLGAGALLGGLG